MASTVLPNGIIVPEKFSRDWYADLYHNWQELDNLLGGGTPKDGTLTIQKNGTAVGTFSANQATDETVNIEVPDVNNGTLTIQQNGTTVDTFTANSSSDKTVNISVPTKTSDLNNDSGFVASLNNNTFFSWDTPVSGKVNIKVDQTWLGGILTTANTTIPTNTNELTNGAGFITADYAVPRSGGAVMNGLEFTRVDDNGYIVFKGGTATSAGASIWLYGKDESSQEKGKFWIGASNATSQSWLVGTPDGSLSWKGQPIQYGSDARLKQQIAEIDDKLLDAWEDVEPSQFKYNDAVDQKGKDKARLHTGFVVQQIDKACQSHGVDISQYGLYCHEEYPQETEEVEVEQDDGTKVKETKVIREASEHYSLRYTEVYAVECMYLRRCIARLTARIEELEKGNNTK